MLQCVTLWIGDKLGPVERACLRSVNRQGHAVALYCYTKVEGVPLGVELRDASTVLPESHIFRQRNGSVASFSDWFRYELLRLGAGTWIDTDIYLLKPLDEAAEYLFGEEEPGIINNAVLRLPARSALLSSLLEVFERRRTPSWLPWRAFVAVRARQLVNGQVDLTRLKWGATGPMALSSLARDLGLATLAHPAEVFNPIPWSKANWILDPAVQLEQLTTERTVAVHLWNYCISEFKNAPAPHGSFLERLQQEGA